MANSFVTAADLLQLADGNISDIQVSDLLEETPLLKAMSSIVASNSTSHEWLKKTAAPAAGFRAINDGVENTKATYTKVTQALKLFDAGFDIDMGLLKAEGGEALKRREAIDHLIAAFVGMESQIIYGTDSDAVGFNGFADLSSVDAVADEMVVDAGGTTASTASSVWAIRLGESAVSAVYGLGGQIEIGQEYSVLRSGSVTGSYDAMRTPILFYGGLQVATNYDLGRIANVTEDAGKGLTDDLLSELIGKFPAGRAPSVIAMSRRSLRQLQQSRTATNPTGAPAPFPSDAFGIQLIATDQISDTEAILT
jgi:hypothetical protein